MRDCTLRSGHQHIAKAVAVIFPCILPLAYVLICRMAQKLLKKIVQWPEYQYIWFHYEIIQT